MDRDNLTLRLSDYLFFFSAAALLLFAAWITNPHTTDADLERVAAYIVNLFTPEP